MTDNLPMGAAEDSSAPFYERIYGEMDCPVCRPNTMFKLFIPHDENCFICDGIGKVPMTEQDYLDKLESLKEDRKGE